MLRTSAPISPGSGRTEKGGDPLTERKQEVLQLLTEGKSMKQVACVLNLSTSTVAFHKMRIKEILHARTDADLVQHAIKKHLIPA
jgi:DNA-binding CsgD family transcriptional regulator